MVGCRVVFFACTLGVAPVALSATPDDPGILARLHRDRLPGCTEERWSVYARPQLLQPGSQGLGGLDSITR